MKRQGFALVVAAAMVASLAALAAAAPVEITFATWAFSGANADAIKQSVSRFEAQHPDVHVVIEQVPCCNAKTIEKYVTQIAGGAGPDVMQIPYASFAEMAESGALLDLDPFIAADAAVVDPNDIFPPAWTAVTYNGKRYGMPYDLSAQWMAFMPELFTQSGAADPIGLYRKGQWTWETLRSAAKKLTVRDAAGKPNQIGMVIQWGELLGQPWLYQTGTTPFASDLKSADFSDPRIVQALQFLSDMAQQDGSLLATWSTPTADPKQGRFGVWPQWLSIPYYFKGSSVHADIVPAPEGPVGHVDTGQIHAISVWSGTPHPKEAWAFAASLTGKDGYRDQIAAGLAPIRKSLVPFYLSTVKALGATGADLFLQDIGRLRLFQVTPHWTEVSAAFTSGMAPVWAGKGSVKTALEQIQPKVNGLLSE